METEFVILNLRGYKFEVLKRTFEKFNLDKVEHRKTGENEYYISRDPKFFNSVLNWAEYNKICCDSPYTQFGALEEAAVYGFCNCTATRSPASCPRGHHEKLQIHKQKCFRCRCDFKDCGSKKCKWI